MKCRSCDSFMVVDDRDVISRGNFDVYWICPCCTGSCIQQIRNSRPVLEFWHFENDGIEDYSIFPGKG